MLRVKVCTLVRRVRVAVPQATQSGRGPSGLFGPSKRLEEGCSFRYVLRSAEEQPGVWCDAGKSRRENIILLRSADLLKHEERIEFCANELML